MGPNGTIMVSDTSIAKSGEAGSVPRRVGESIAESLRAQYNTPRIQNLGEAELVSAAIAGSDNSIRSAGALTPLTRVVPVMGLRESGTAPTISVRSLDEAS